VGNLISPGTVSLHYHSFTIALTDEVIQFQGLVKYDQSMLNTLFN